MRIVLLLMVFLAASLFTGAQSYEIQILRQQIKEHPQPDTFRVNRLNEICNATPRIPLDEMEKFATEALLLSRKSGYKTGEAYALIGLARTKYIGGSTDEGLILLEQADSIAKRSRDEKLQFWVIYRLASCYLVNDNKKALLYNVKALEYAQKINNKDLISLAYLTTGENYSQVGEYAKAIENVMAGLKIAEEIGSLSRSRSAWADFGGIYLAIGDYNKAAIYSRKALDANKKLGYDESANASLLNNIGESSRLTGKYDDAIRAYEEILELAKDPYDIETIESNMADVYVNLDRLPLAFKYAFSSLSAARKLNDLVGIAWTSSILSRAYLKKNMVDSALYYGQLGLHSAEEVGAGEYIRDNTKALADVYAYKNDFRNAYTYHKLFINYRDSLTNAGLKNKIAVLEYNTELEKKEGQIALLNQQKNSQQNFLVAVSIALLLILVLAISLLRSNQQKQKAKMKIEKAYDQLKNTQAQLIHSEKMASLGEVTAGIAHEIQNPLNFVNNFSEVNEELIEELEGERRKVKGERDETLENEIINDIKQNLEKINHHGKRADAIVKGMLQHSKQTTGVKEPTDINKLADEYLRLAYHGMRAKDKEFNAEIKTEFDETIGKIDVLRQDIGRVLLNLYNNAFYAVNEKKRTADGQYQPTVFVSTKKFDHIIEIAVRDNGPGIPQNIVDKIFQPFFTTKPTGQGTGLGLSLAYDIVKAHGGEIKVETREGEGSTFIMQLPFNP